MTDNEIIKTLELEAIYCRGEGNMYGPTKKTFVDAELIEGALALINRQKTEIERLQKAIKVQDIMIEQQDYKIKSKSEVIKEFAERLKENKIDIDVSFGYGREHYTEAVAVVEIDRLVKEFMEGKADDQG